VAHWELTDILPHASHDLCAILFVCIKMFGLDSVQKMNYFRDLISLKLSEQMMNIFQKNISTTQC
jgi:hypothetical protein